MVLTNEILPPNRRAIFARCLDSELRFVPQVIAGLPVPSASSHGQCLCAGLRAGTAPQERIKCANQTPASMKESIRRGSESG
jgi:hypothetical protein